MILPDYPSQRLVRRIHKRLKALDKQEKQQRYVRDTKSTSSFRPLFRKRLRRGRKRY